MASGEDLQTAGKVVGGVSTAAAAVPVAGWIIAGIGSLASAVLTGVGRKKQREDMMSQGREQINQMAEARKESSRQANLQYAGAMENIKTEQMRTDVQRGLDERDMETAVENRNKRLEQTRTDLFNMDTNIREQDLEQRASARGTGYGL